SMLADRCEDGGQLSQLGRRLGRTGAVQRTTIQGHAQDSNVGPDPRGRSFEAAPRLEPGGVEKVFAHVLRNAAMASTCAAIKVGVHPCPADSITRTCACGIKSRRLRMALTSTVRSSAATTTRAGLRQPLRKSR